MSYDWIDALAGIIPENGEHFCHSIDYAVGKVLNGRSLLSGYNFSLDSDLTSAEILERTQNIVNEHDIKDSYVYMKSDSNDGRGMEYLSVGEIIDGTVNMDCHPTMLKEKKEKTIVNFLKAIINDGFLVAEDYSNHIDHFYSLWKIEREDKNWTFSCITAEYPKITVTGGYKEIKSAFWENELCQIFSIDDEDKNWLKENNWIK